MAAETVKVIVRCRPLNDREKNLKCETVIQMDSKRAQVYITNGADKKAPPKSFTFDGAYYINSTTEQIYNEIGYPLVEGVTEGYNGTIFAYGQTGCGKSFSMQGITDPLTQRGIIPRAFDHIFETISVTEGTKFLVHASYLEIYNEEVRDLLGKDTKARLELKEHPEKGIYVQSLSQHPVHNVPDCEAVMHRGWKNRSVGATLMNADSSRSHSIFTIYMEMCLKDAEGEEHIRAGKLNLVDLAGSERQSKTASTGDRLKEATKINLSLSALGNVISALVDGKSKHIPYRDAKLTRLLQDSLGGNTKTLMVACISPADNNYEESLSTLRYANRAKNIKNKPKINEDPKDALLREYQEEIERLKAMLMGKMPVNVDALSVKKSDTPSLSRPESSEISREDLEHERRTLKEEYDHKLQEIESRYEEEKTGKVRLEQDINRLRQFYDEKLKTVDGRLAHLPSTAAASQTTEVVVMVENEVNQNGVTQSKVTRNEVKRNEVTDETNNEAQPPGIEQRMDGPDTTVKKAKLKTTQALSEELTENRLQLESLAENEVNLVGPLLPEMQVPPGWFETKNLPVEHQELLHRLKELQMQMVGGENVDNEEVKERHQERIKFAEKRKAQLAEAIAGMDDDGIMLTIYDTIQDELRHKNELLELEKNKVMSLECEISDIQSEFEFDRIDYLDTVRKQSKQLKLLEAIIDKMQPCVRRDCNYSNLDRIRVDAKWDENNQVWVMPKLVMEKMSLPNTGAIVTNGHDTNDRHQLNERDISQFDDYFQSKRLEKYVGQASSSDHRLAITDRFNDIPYTNGHTSLDDPLKADMHAAQVHGQLISPDDSGVRRPARLESLPLGGGKRNRKKRSGHIT